MGGEYKSETGIFGDELWYENEADVRRRSYLGFPHRVMMHLAFRSCHVQSLLQH